MKRLLTFLATALATLTIGTGRAAAATIADGTYFIKTDGGKFWTRGEPYGSAVQLYDWGLPVKIVTDGEGVSTLKFGDAADWLIFDDGNAAYADNANPANKSWTIAESSGKYTFKNTVSNRYMSTDGTRILTSANENDAYAFTLVSANEHRQAMTSLVNRQASEAASMEGLSASTADELAASVESLTETVVMAPATPSATAEKYQGGQWDSRTVYKGSVNITTPGLYKFTIQAFYRMTDNDATYTLHTEGADCPPVYVFLGEARTPIASVFDCSNQNNDNCYTAADGKFYPDGQTAALTAFKAGNYTNTVWAYISEAGSYDYGIQYIGWAGSHAEWTCYTANSVSLTLYSQDLWPPFQSIMASCKPYDDISAAYDATGYTAQYDIYKTYTSASATQRELKIAIDYIQENYPVYQWSNASPTHPVDVTEGIVAGADCTSNDAWPGSGRTTATGTYHDGTTRTYFTQNHEEGAARSQTVTIAHAGAYLLRTIVKPTSAAAYATIGLGSQSTTTRGIATGQADIGHGWTYNDVYCGVTTDNAQMTITIALSNVNAYREADCGEMHLYYIGRHADVTIDGTRRYLGVYDTAPVVETTDLAPVVDVTAAAMTGGTVTPTNPNGLVFANSGQLSTTRNVVVDGTCADLRLESGHPFANPRAFTATAATYELGSSSVAGGLYATLLLPFEATTMAGTAYALDRDIDLMSGTIGATAVATIQANSPVLVTKAGSYAAQNTTVQATTGADAHVAGQLVGVYSDTTAPVGSYVLQNHSATEGVAFYLVGGTQPVVGPFRAYIKPQASGSRAVRVVVGQPSAIDTAAADSHTSATVYAPDGTRRSAMHRGLNIVRTADGGTRKVIVN